MALATELRGTVMPRLRKVAGMCSSKVAEMRICGYHAEEKSSAVPLFSQRSHVGNLRQTLQGKGVIHKRVETAGVYPLVRPRGVSALPAEVQRKTPRPLGANTLTQFEYPAQPVLKKAAAPDRANTLTQFASPAQPVLKKSCRP